MPSNALNMHNRKSGFSLLELIIYMGVLAAVVVVVVGISAQLGTGIGKAQAQAEVNSNLRFAIDKIESDLRSATQIVVPAASGTTTSTLTLNASGTTITYCVAGGALRRQLGAATTTTVSNLNRTVSGKIFFDDFNRSNL